MTMLLLLLIFEPFLAENVALAEINRAFCHHRFDPAIMAPFDRRQLDPVIVEAEWEGVRGHVEAALKPIHLGIRPISLPCQFRPLPAADDHKGEKPHHLIPVFVFEKGNNRAKAVLKQALNLTDNALWDYEPETGRINTLRGVTETRATTTGAFKPQYRKESGIDLLQVHIGLQELVCNDENSLKPFRFETTPARIAPNRGLHFATVWKPHWKSTHITFAWRLKVILEKIRTEPDAWELIAKVEVGKKYNSQLDYSVAGDSMKGELSMLSTHMHVFRGDKNGTIFHNAGKLRLVGESKIMRGEPFKAEVPPPIERITAVEASPLEVLADTFADLCQAKLLASKVVP